MNVRRKILIFIGTAILAIVFGAIGSGLWERCFSRLFDSCIKVIVSIMSFLSSNYKNDIYKEAAKGFHEYSSLFLHALVLSILPLMYVTLLLKHPHKRRESPPSFMRTFISSRNGYYLLVILTATVIVSFFLSLTRVTYINSVVTTSRQSISILAPKISDAENKGLWSLFYSMNSENDFNILKEKLQQLAKVNSVKLPSFDQLWMRK